MTGVLKTSVSSPNTGASGHRPLRVIRARKNLAWLNFGELWRYRELFVFLAWRDTLVRYKQTFLGVAWALLQPFLTMMIFAVLFGRLARFPSNGVPYPLMTLAGLLPWQFFSTALSECAGSLVGSANMISKVYFPRIIVPASAILSGILNFLISLVLLTIMMIWYHARFYGTLILLPFYLAAACVVAFSGGVWLSALNVRYRDVSYIVPFITRMGLYVSPVAFMSSMVLDKFGPRIHFLFCLNPMAGVIDGFRWCILGPRFAPYWPGFAASMGLTVLMMIAGVIYFRTAEKLFADVI